jgi:hypothetical protein
LKAIDIINFINEDKFAKYTIKQIYDELGEDEFSDYIKELVYKVIKKENIEGLKHAEFTKENNLGKIFLSFAQDQKYFINVIRVAFSENFFWVDGMLLYPNGEYAGITGGDEIKLSSVNLFNILSSFIKKNLNDPNLINLRNKLIKNKGKR